MSGLAEILLTLGCRVTGSDLKRSPLTERLGRRGARIFIGHHASQVGDPQVVVTSSAVARSNPEVAAAVRKGIPVIARGELLAELMRLKYGIAVAGSHGKTTTTSLVAAVLEEGHFDPTVVIGGRVRSLRSNARLGRGDFLVAEADESDGSFLHLSPAIAVVTNIDREHMDHYRDFETLRKTFEEFVSKIPFYGAAVFCADHPESARLAARFTKRGVTYGIREKADYQASRIRLGAWESLFDVRYRGTPLGRIRLRHPGIHNVLNSLAAIAVGRELGMRFADIRRALGKFRGIGRRLELVYPKRLGEGRRGSGLATTPIIIDDYGHHPAEIRATLATVRKISSKGHHWVLFQPHRYTRTKDLFDEFAGAFGEADELIVTDIYAAGEEPIHGISGRSLARAIAKKKRRPVRFIPMVGEVAEKIFPEIRKGDLVLTLGAGDIWKAGRELAKKIGESVNR